MKKKKSKKQASDFAKELDELDAEQNEEDAANTLPVDDGAVTGENGEKIDPWVAENRRATYPEVSPRAASYRAEEIGSSPHSMWS